MKSTAFVASLLLTAWSASSVRAAGLCGDDVGGSRVACRCGDVVVSDTTLAATDPVVLERCLGDGLIVRATAAAPSIRLDLGGHSLLGSGSGSGIRVVAGGRDGAVIEGGAQVSRAVVAGFSTGVRATGRRSLAEVRGLDVNGNRRDGLALWGHEVRLVDVVADQNGRDGVHVGGRQSSLEGVRADRNGRYGVRVTRDAARLDGSGRNNRRGNVVRNPRDGAVAE